jgi:site-specific recombinase XerD
VHREVSRMSDDLRPMPPETAKDIYLEQRRDEVSKQTLQSHEYRIDQFVEWCQEVAEIDNMNDVSGMDLHNYRVYRREEDDLKSVTLQGQLSTLRQFLRVCASVDAVDEELADKILLPNVSKSEESNDEMLEANRAQAALEYLNDYEYATREHVTLVLLWRTSMRRGELHALDLGDFDQEEPALEIRHRPESDTPLKNQEWSERDISINEEVADLLQDYIRNRRHRVRDDYNRRPLITTKYGRVTLGTIKEDMYKVTRPCEYGLECPHDRDPSDCEAMETHWASKCPSSRSPHAIRTGSVTAHLDAGTPKAILGDRVDMSEDTMDLHYDKASQRERMYRREDYIPDDI